MSRRIAALLVSVALVAAVAACTDDGPAGSDSDAGAGPEPGAAQLRAAIEDRAADTELGCDPLDGRHCLLPFPSDAATVADGASSTGRRVALPAGGMPTNADAMSIDPSEWNRNDGFSPSTALLTYVDGLDFEATDLPPWTDLGSSLSQDATVVVVDMDSGERIPVWAEPDERPDDDADRMLMIRPAVALPEGHRIAVGLRDLVSTDGDPVVADPVFQAYRDDIDTGDARLEERRARLEEVFDALDDAGVPREDLVLAWDFTVASERNLSERMLHIRDEALEIVDRESPAFTVTSATSDPTDLVAIEITGTYEVPSFLTGDGGPGSRFSYPEGEEDPDRLPGRNGSVTAPFRCQVPEAALRPGAAPPRLALYGHGLLGSENEVGAGNVRAMADEHGIIFCATKWAGMSADDVGNAVATLNDVSNFPTIADRLQQGVLNQIVLGRLMLDPDGLLADPAFGGVEVDRTALFYDGNSQGGIMGGMLAAVSPDVERSVLGVPGMNYGLLLHRSVDWDGYEEILEPAYPDDLDRTLIVALIQMLWDRGEAAGYVHHIGQDPYPGSKGGHVLLHVALGDHQVTEVAAMVQARTIGASIHTPVVADGRSRERNPGWGIEAIEYPHRGSAIVFWDSGAAVIPFEAVAPRAGSDPHEDPRADPEVRRQKATFLFDGEVIDVCDGEPCEVAATR